MKSNPCEERDRSRTLTLRVRFLPSDARYHYVAGFVSITGRVSAPSPCSRSDLVVRIQTPVGDHHR